MQKVLSVVGDYLLGWLYVLVILAHDQSPKEQENQRGKSRNTETFPEKTPSTPTNLFLWGLGLCLLGMYIIIWLNRGEGAAAMYGAIITLIAIGILSMVKIR